MIIQDVAQLDISNVLTNLAKLEANYKAVGARLGSTVRLNLDTAQAETKLKALEARVIGLRGQNVPIGAAAAQGAVVTPHLNPESVKALEVQVVSLVARLNKTLELTVRLRFSGNDPIAEFVRTVMRAIHAIEDLNSTLTAGGKITTAYRQTVTGVDTRVIALARTIKQLAQEQGNSKIKSDEFTNSMKALRGQVEILSSSAALGSKDAIILGQAYKQASIALGETQQKASPLAQSIESIRVRVAGLRAEYQVTGGDQKLFAASMQKLIDEGNALNITIDKDAASFYKLQTALRPASAAIDALDGRLSRLGLASQVGAGLGQTNKLLSGLSSGLGFLPGPLGLVATFAQTASASLRGLTLAEVAAAAPAIALGAALVGVLGTLGLGVVNAAKFERELGSISSVGNLTAGDMKILKKTIQDLSTALPLTETELAGVARNAELLGVRGAKDIGDFTTVVAKLGIASREIGGEAINLQELGTTVAQFLNQTGSNAKTYAKDIGTVAASLAAVDKATESTLPTTLAIASNLAKTGISAGLTREQIVGLAGAFAGLKVAPEAAGNALFQIIKKIETAGNTGGKSLQNFAHYANTTTEEFQRLAKTDPGAAFLKLTEGIGKSGAKGAEFSKILDELGIKNVRSIGLLGVGTTGYLNLARGVKAATDATGNKAALDQRADEATRNLLDDLTKLSHAVVVFTQNIGEPLLKPLDEAVKFLLDLFTGAKHLGDYLPTLATAIGFVTLAYGLQSKTLKGLLELEALQTGLSANKGIVSTYQALRTVFTGFPALIKAAGVEFATVNGLIGVSGPRAVGLMIRQLALLKIAAGSIVGPFALAVGALGVYANSIIDQTKAAYDENEKNSLDAQQKLMERVKALSDSGPLGKLKAKQLLTVELRYQDGNSAETNKKLDERLAKLKVQVTAQAAIDAANGKNGKSTGEVTKATDAQISKYGELETKLVDLSSKYGVAKLTPFQTGVIAARKEVETLNKAIDEALKKGNLTEAQGKALKGQAAGIASRSVLELSQRQLDEDGKALQSHERDIQSGLTGLIDDGRAKRSAVLAQEVKDITEKYAPQIKAALQNAQNAPPAQAGQFRSEAARLRTLAARETAVANQKAQNDLDDIDRARVQKARANQKALLDEAKRGLSLQTAAVQQQQQDAITAAGSSAQAILAATRRFSPQILQAKQNELKANSIAERQQAKTDLDNALQDAQSAGAAQGQQGLVARRIYLAKLRNLDRAGQNELNALRVSSAQAEQNAEAAVIKDGVSKQLADTKRITGRGLDELAALYTKNLALAAKAGNAPVLAEYKNALDQVKSLQEKALSTFKDVLAATATSITDLRKKLNDAIPKRTELAQSRSTAAKPFEDDAKTGLDALKKLETALKNTSKSVITPEYVAQYQNQVKALNLVVQQARAQGQAAELQATKVYEAKRIAEANAYVSAVKAGEGSLLQARANFALKTASTDADVLNARQRLIAVDAQAVQAQRDALARLPGERTKALAAAQTPEDRQRVTRDYNLRSQAAMNALVAAQNTLYDSTQAKLQAELAIGQRGLTVQDLQNKLAAAKVPLLERGLFAANQDYETAQRTLAVNQKDLLLLTLRKAGRDALQAAEDRVTSSQTDLLAKKEALDLSGVAALKTQFDQNQRNLTAQQAQNQLIAQRTPLLQRNLITAQLEAAQSLAVLANSRTELATLSKTAATKAELDNASLAVTNAETAALTTQEKLEAQINTETAKRVATTQLELAVLQSRRLATAQLNGQANDAVAAARAELKNVQEDLIQNRFEQASLRDQVDSRDKILTLQDKENKLVGQRALAEQRITQTLKDRQVVLESVAVSERNLNQATTVQVIGIGKAQQGVKNTTDDLTTSERRYAQTLKDVKANQNDTTTTAYRTSVDDLTSKINAQRTAVKGLAQGYRDEIVAMDGVRAASERLSKIVKGQDTGVIKQGEVNKELGTFYAIQQRRDDALDRLRAAIKTGDSKKIAAATDELTAQQDRYQKQADRITKGTGIQLSLTGGTEVSSVLDQLEALNLKNDQISPEIQKRADVADQEAESASTILAAMNLFQSSVDELRAVLSKPPVKVAQQFSSGPTTYVTNGMRFSSLAAATAYLDNRSAVPGAALPPSTAGMVSTRGGDTININIPITLNGQPVPTPDEFRQLARGEIAGAIQDAQRNKAWKAGC